MAECSVLLCIAVYYVATLGIDFWGRVQNSWPLPFTASPLSLEASLQLPLLLSSATIILFSQNLTATPCRLGSPPQQAFDPPSSGFSLEFHLQLGDYSSSPPPTVFPSNCDLFECMECILLTSRGSGYCRLITVAPTWLLSTTLCGSDVEHSSTS